MKKIIAGVVSVILLIGLVIYYFVACVGAKSSSGWDITKDLDYFNMSHRYGVVAEYRGDAKDIVIADTYNNQPVTTITNGAFADKEIESVMIPATVTTINSRAFSNCKKLESVIFEDASKLEYIGEKAFEGCSKLQGIILPDGVKTIVANAFTGCSSIQTIKIPETVTAIPNEAFANCTKLASIDLPDGLTSIGADAIKNTAIYNNASKWEDGALYVDSYLFDTDKQAEGEFVVKQGTTVIAAKSFMGSINLLAVELPQELVAIGQEAFNGCISLIEIYNKSAIDIQIGFKEDMYNSKLTGNAGLYAKNIYTEGQGKLVEENGVWMYEKTLVKYFGDETEIVIDDGIEEINTGTFFGDTKLVKITIPASMKTIGQDAFAGCTNLANVIFNGTVDQWASIAFANNESNPLASGTNEFTVNGAKLTEATLTVENVGASAFVGCETLEKVTFTADVKASAKNAFYNCTSLKTVNYTGTADQWAQISFENNNANPITFAHTFYINDVVQNEITLTVEEVAKSVFNGCYTLNKVNFASTVKKINTQAFNNCFYLVEASNKSSNISLTASAKNGEIGKYLLAVYDDETKTNLAKDANGFLVFTNDDAKVLVKYVGTAKNIVLPEVTKVKDYALMGATITSVEIPATVTEIGKQSFANCSALESVKFTGESKIEKIGELAFYQCLAMKSFVMPKSVKTIGERAFTYDANCYIYLYESQKPSGWNNNWIDKKTNVKWDGEWELVEGVPTIIEK